jgi:N-acetylglucosaminyl-diphospho-decaprenol L-rhamnosyltransferase
MPPWVTVLIITYNAGDWILHCLEGLAAQSDFHFTAMLVDNASTDGSLEAIPAYPWLKIVRNRENMGFAAANNQAAKLAETPWIALLNPDAIPAPDWLAQLHAATDAHPEYAVFGSTQRQLHDPHLADGFGDQVCYGIPFRSYYGARMDALPTADREVFSPCGASALYRRDVFLQLGGFDARFFCYCEDVELGFRLQAAGYRCLQLRHALVNHAGSALTGKRSDFSTYHGFRNRFWMAAKHLPFRVLVMHLLLTKLLFYQALFRGQGRSAWRGWRDGMRGACSFWKERSTTRAPRHTQCWNLRVLLTRRA